MPHDRQHAMPSVIQGKLRSIRLRQVMLALLQGMAIAIAVLLIAMIATMSIDWMTRLFSVRVRVLLTITTFGLAVAAFAYAVIPTMVTIFRRTQPAEAADQAIPQLEERWTTVASFARSNQQPSNPVSQAMLEQVNSEAVAMQRLVSPTRVVHAATLRPALLATAAAVLLFTGFMLLRFEQTSVLFQRFLHPTSNITATTLQSLTGDLVVPRGETRDIQVAVSGMMRSSALLTIERDSVIDVFELEPDAETKNRFVHSLRVDESLRYRVESGDGRTEWHTITAIDFPQLAEVQLLVTPPAYLNSPPIEKALIPSRLKVVQGSRLTLRLKPTEPLESMQLSLVRESNESKEAQRVAVRLEPDGEGWYRYSEQLLTDLAFSPAFRNMHGLENEEKRTCHIHVIEDKAPVARIISPTEEAAVAVDDKVEIEFEAHDDHGIAKAELVVYDETDVADGEDPKILEVIEIPLGDDHLSKHLMSRVELDLTKLDVLEGTAISYAIRVTDNRQMEFDPATMAAQQNASASSQSGQQDDLDGSPGSESPQDQVAQNTASEQSETSPSESPLPVTDSPRTVAEDVADDSGSQSDEAAAPMKLAGNDDATDTPSPGDELKNPGASGNRDSDESSERGSGETSPRSVAQSQPDTKPSDSDPSDSDPSDADPSGAEPSSVEPGELAGAEGQVRGDREDNTNEAALSDQKLVDKNRLAQGSDNAAQSPADQSASGDNPEASNTAPAESVAMAPLESRPPLPPLENATERPAATETAGAPPQESEMSETSGDPSASPNESAAPSSVAAADVPPGQSSPAGQQDASRQDPSRQDPNQQATNQQSTSQAGTESQPGNPKQGGSDKREQDSARTPRPTIAMSPQQSTSGQDTETRRRRLLITQRLASVSRSEEVVRETASIRDRVVAIDTMLQRIETSLQRVVQREIPDADRSAVFTVLDQELGEIEKYISELREETKEGEFAFVGLQMVDIGRTHVTPARDRVFVAIRDPIQGMSNATSSLGHVVRARELLAALLVRYDEAVRETRLADAIEESVEIYEVYVERMQKLMRERRQNQNPLERAMAVVEVDQEYLDRYAEVLGLRREMMREFGRMLAEDPRLLARYIDLVKRRNKSLRDQLSDLAERQDDVAYELSGWMMADEDQRMDVWTIVIETRLLAIEELAQEAAELAERAQKQLPLIVESDHPVARRVLEQTETIAELARTMSFEANQLMLPENGEAGQASQRADELVLAFAELDAALDRMVFKFDDAEEVAAYVNSRLAESRAVANRAERWQQIVNAILAKRYSHLVELDQWQLNIATELLRIEMLAFEDDIEGQFRQEAETATPGEIVDMIRQLHRVMESITFNQSAATFALHRESLPRAEQQQAQALARFELAEELFDMIRKAIIAELDQYEVDDPNIADLEDPTLDEFLAQLEREPNIQALLGIPNRPSNLRVLADTLSMQSTNGSGLGDSAAQARQRAKRKMELAQRKQTRDSEQEMDPAEMSAEQRAQLEKAKQMQERLEESLASIEQRAADPETPDAERRKLEQMADNLKRILQQVSEETVSAEQWEQIVQQDQTAEMMKALARGEPLPDEQWNKLMSTLEDGLWQVRGTRPPEEYRRAIEQYQDRLRQLMSSGLSETE